MPIKASIQHHTPEQVYDFLINKVGLLHLLIKNGMAYITFMREEDNDLVREKFQGVNICGKKIYWEKYHLENGIEVDDHDQFDLPHGNFIPENEVEKAIYEGKIMMMEKMEQMFQVALQQVQEKVRTLSSVIQEEEFRKREFTALSESLRKKFLKMVETFGNSISKLPSFVQSFSSQPVQIDIQTSYTASSTWRFPQIQLSNFEFQSSMEHHTLFSFPIKKLCALNGKDWVTTTQDANSKKGSICFNNIDISNARDCFDVNDGAYGLEVANDFVFVGSYESTINCLNLKDERLKVESSGKLPGFSNRSLIFDIQKVPNIHKFYLSTLSMDSCFRLYEVCNDEIQTGIVSLGFHRKQDIYIKNQLSSLQFLNERELLLGGLSIIKKYDIERKTMREIPIRGKVQMIKKLTEHPCVVACAVERKLQLIDMRCSSVVRTFPQLKNQIRCIEVINGHTIIYGAANQIGMMDDRKANSMLWRDNQFHIGKIHDIVKLEDRIVSGDSKGALFSWKPHYY